MAAVAGYNIAFKIGTGSSAKTLAGRTQDDLTIAARTKESLTKDDQGATQVSVIGHDVTFRASGLIDVTGGTNKLDRDDILADALKTGTQAVIAFTYMATGGASYTGNCVITNYSESSNASDDGTYTVDFRVTGSMTLVS